MPPTPLPFDAELIARHDRPGPRYTSYPPAPRFHEGFGRREFEAAIARSNEEPLPRRLSLYVHVPFCHSPCFYCGCNRVITRDAARGPAYRQRLQHEIDRIAPLFAPDREVVQLHFGGGTPNFLPVPELAAIVGHLRRHFVFADERQADLSLEVDPRSLAPDAMPGLRAIGFNRISLGIQDFDPAVQAAVNRRQGFETTHALVEAARAAGMRSVNVDLIYGLPRQSAAGFARTLEQVLALRPDRIAVYSYAHLPETFKAQRQIDAADLPSPATKLSLLGIAVEKLAAAGYRYIGMDHFALPGDDLARAQEEGRLARNFQGYTVRRADELLGIGVSAIGELAGVYFQNHRDIARYNAAVDEGRLPLERGYVRSAEDLLRGRVIEELMCHFRLDGRALGERFGVDFWRHFAAERRALEALAAEGLAAFEGEVLRATPLGRLLVRRLAMVFDAHLAGDGGRERYSRIL